MKYSLIDCHCDTASIALDKNIGFWDNGLHVDFSKIKDIGYTQFFAAFIAPQFKNVAMERAIGIIKKLKSELDENTTLCVSYKDYVKNKGKIRVFLSLEGGEPITDLSALRNLYDEGIRMATLTWNYSNHLAAGVLEESDGMGVTRFGKEVIEEMNNLGMIVDVSHLNEHSFWDVVDISKKPIIASHSNSRTICDNKRNITDEQFLAIKKLGGVVGINLYPLFLSGKEKASIADVIKHIEHFLSIGGEDNICMGTDFDGIDYLPENIYGIWDVYKLFDEMLKLGYDELLINKLSCTNMERILQEIL